MKKMTHYVNLKPNATSKAGNSSISLPIPPSPQARQTPEPMQRFENFARKLVSIPKEEVDHEEKNYEHRKKRREAKRK